jgi:histone acetyltransferase
LFTLPPSLHRSVVIVRRGGQVIGGITYRTFPGTPAARLGEIAFCAVAQTLQVTGYGTRLMNWTKVSLLPLLSLLVVLV